MDATGNCLLYDRVRAIGMSAFEIGDRVRVSSLIASEYADSLGVVVTVEQRDVGPLQVTDCRVEFKDGRRRWCPSFHLQMLKRPDGDER